MSPPFVAHSPHDDFETSFPTLWSTKSHNDDKYGQGPCIVVSYPQPLSPTQTSMLGYLFVPQVELTPHFSLDTPTNTF